MFSEPGRRVFVYDDTDHYPDADPVSLTITVTLSHGNSKSYPYFDRITVPDADAGLAIANAIRDAVRNAV